MNSLEKLSYLKTEMKCFAMCSDIKDDNIDDDFKPIEKDLKAFEIIKKYKNDILFIFEFLHKLNYSKKEEYDLLKECLK